MSSQYNLENFILKNFFTEEIYNKIINYLTSYFNIFPYRVTPVLSGTKRSLLCLVSGPQFE